MRMEKEERDREEEKGRKRKRMEKEERDREEEKGMARKIKVGIARKRMEKEGGRREGEVDYLTSNYISYLTRAVAICTN
jgi:hypothetical protein